MKGRGCGTMVKRSPPTPEVHSSSPVIGNVNIT